MSPALGSGDGIAGGEDDHLTSGGGRLLARGGLQGKGNKQQQHRRFERFSAYEKKPILGLQVSVVGFGFTMTW